LKNKLILSIFFLIINLTLFSEQLKLVGNYIQLSVSRTDGKFLLYGRNSIKTKWIPLTFENFPSTSYFKIFQHNGAEIKFGQSGNGFQIESKIVDEKIIYIWQSNYIKIELDYKLIPDGTSQYANTMIMNMNMTNLTEKETNIDYYFCIDTCLGEKSKHPFILLNNTVIDSEIEFKGNEIPSSVLSTDEKLNLGLESFFKTDDNTNPTRIFFANWKRVSEYPGFYKIEKERNFDLKPYSLNDSAAYLEYENQKIDVKGTKNYSFIFKMKGKITGEEVSKKTEKPEEEIKEKMQETIKEEPLKEEPKKEIKKEEKVEQSKTTDYDSMSVLELLQLIDDINKKMRSSNITEDEVNILKKRLEDIQNSLKK
jgi:hypothetical protein